MKTIDMKHLKDICSKHVKVGDFDSAQKLDTEVSTSSKYNQKFETYAPLNKMFTTFSFPLFNCKINNIFFLW